jgi:hypothetical protein
MDPTPVSFHQNENPAWILVRIIVVSRHSSRRQRLLEDFCVAYVAQGIDSLHIQDD